MPPAGPGLGLEFDETEARKRPSRDTRLPQRYWPDGSVGDYWERSSSSALAAASIDCSRQPGAKGDCCSW